MLCPPSCFPAIKREIRTENRFSPPRTPPASFPRIKGSQQCYNTGCIPPRAVVAGGVVAVAAASVAAALTAVAAVAVTGRPLHRRIRGSSIREDTGVGRPLHRRIRGSSVGEDTGVGHHFSRGCFCSKCHCRRCRLLRSLQRGEHRYLHGFRLEPLQFRLILPF